MNKRKLRLTYRKYLFSYTFEVFQPRHPLINKTTEAFCRIN